MSYNSYTKIPELEKMFREIREIVSKEKLNWLILTEKLISGTEQSLTATNFDSNFYFHFNVYFNMLIYRGLAYTCSTCSLAATYFMNEKILHSLRSFRRDVLRDIM